MKRLIVLCTLFASMASLAQQTPCPTTTLDAWINCQLEQVAAAKINQRDGTKQDEAPASGSGSTTLVDKSAGPDIGALALTLASISGATTGTSTTTPLTFTASAYSLIAAKNGKALDPHFYNAYRNWRRFSFTLGKEDNDDSNDGPADIFGAKLLIIDERDASAGRNKASIESVAKALKSAAVNYAQVRRAITDYIFTVLGPGLGLDITDPQQKVNFINNQLGPKLAETVKLLNAEQVAHIEEIINNNIDAEVKFSDTATKAIEEIRRGAQLGFAFTSKIRPHLPVDDYSLEVTWDWGLYRRLNWTANASYFYRNFTDLGADIRGGRFASQFEYRINPEEGFKTGAIKIAVSAEGKWQTQTSSTYTVQGKLTFPILQGVTLPVSVAWANRTDLVKGDFVRGNFGLTVDVSKLIAAFQAHTVTTSQ